MQIARSGGMKLNGRKALVIAAMACVTALGSATAAYAQAQGQDQQTPKGWNYEIKDGKRVPKGNRITNPDGSWREELKQGNCVTIKERSAAGEYKETRQCNPNSPG
jgi:hypothetical protein